MWKKIIVAVFIAFSLFSEIEAQNCGGSTRTIVLEFPAGVEKPQALVFAGCVESLIPRIRLRAVPELLLVGIAAALVALLAAAWSLGAPP